MPSLLTITWRYLTGAFIDGRIRNNSTWLTPATIPAHQITWWTRKPRLERMLLRWLMLIMPIGYELAIYYSPTVKFNLALVLSGMFAPYLFHMVIHHTTSRIPRVRVVHVFEDTQHDEEMVDHHVSDKPVPDIDHLTEVHLPAELTQPSRNGKKG